MNISDMERKGLAELSNERSPPCAFDPRFQLKQANQTYFNAKQCRYINRFGKGARGITLKPEKIHHTQNLGTTVRNTHWGNAQLKFSVQMSNIIWRSRRNTNLFASRQQTFLKNEFTVACTPVNSNRARTPTPRIIKLNILVRCLRRRYFHVSKNTNRVKIISVLSRISGLSKPGPFLKPGKIFSNIF